MGSLESRTAAVASLRASGTTVRQMADELGMGETQVSYLIRLQALVPEAWPRVDHLYARPVAALAALAPERQRRVLADPGAPQPLTAAWLIARCEREKPRVPGDHSMSRFRPRRANKAGPSENVEQLRREIRWLEQRLGDRRTGLEFAVVSRRVLADVAELEALLTGTLDGLFVPEVVRWRAAAARAVDCFDAVLSRLREGHDVEWWVPAGDSDRPS